MENINNIYNDKKLSFSKKINLADDYIYNFYNNNDSYFVDIINKSNKSIKLKAEYQIIGIYHISLSFWYWGWSLAYVNKSLISILNKIRQYDINNIHNIDKNVTSKEIEEINYYISNNNFYLHYENLIKILKLVLYLTNGLWYFPIKKGDDKVEFILITKIIQLN